MRYKLLCIAMIAISQTMQYPDDKKYEYLEEGHVIEKRDLLYVRLLRRQYVIRCCGYRSCIYPRYRIPTTTTTQATTENSGDTIIYDETVTDTATMTDTEIMSSEMTTMSTLSSTATTITSGLSSTQTISTNTATTTTMKPITTSNTAQTTSTMKVDTTTNTAVITTNTAVTTSNTAAITTNTAVSTTTTAVITTKTAVISTTANTAVTATLLTTDVTAVITTNTAVTTSNTAAITTNTAVITTTTAVITTTANTAVTTTLLTTDVTAVITTTLQNVMTTSIESTLAQTSTTTIATTVTTACQSKCPTKPCNKMAMLFDSNGNLPNPTLFGEWQVLCNRLYLFGTTFKTFTYDEAFDTCCGLGMELAAFETKAEYDCVSQAKSATAFVNYYLNAHDGLCHPLASPSTGSFLWCSSAAGGVKIGNEITWDAGEPNAASDHCVYMMKSSTNLLRDGHCNVSLTPLCEGPPTTTGPPGTGGGLPPGLFFGK